MTKLIPLSVLVLGFFLAVAETRTEENSRVFNLSENSQLEVSLRTNKRAYKSGDRIRLEVMLTNNHAVQHIFVYGTLEFGYRASFTLFRRDAKGKEVPTRFIDDSSELPPDPNDSSAFVKLLPFHSLGTTYRSSIHLLNFDRPGRYTMWVEYHSPISAAGIKLSPFWSKESGVLRSNIVEIEVRR